MTYPKLTHKVATNIAIQTRATITYMYGSAPHQAYIAPGSNVVSIVRMATVIRSTPIVNRRA